VTELLRNITYRISVYVTTIGCHFLSARLSH